MADSRSGVVVVVAAGFSGNLELARSEARLLADVVKVAKQLAELAMVLCPWDLADVVMEAQQQLADDLEQSRTRDVAACSRALQDQQQRLTRITRGVHRVAAIFMATPLVADIVDKVRPIFEIYAAAIASSPDFIGCNELTCLAETKAAALRTRLPLSP